MPAHPSRPRAEPTRGRSRFANREYVPEPLGRTAHFIAADAEGYDAILLAFDCQLRYAHRAFMPELPNRVEYPSHLQRARDCLGHERIEDERGNPALSKGSRRQKV